MTCLPVALPLAASLKIVASFTAVTAVATRRGRRRHRRRRRRRRRRRLGGVGSRRRDSSSQDRGRLLIPAHNPCSKTRLLSP
uniref:Uncharacterized protein n=1 Tax=Arundo donax TaxID=35708 RepID=A0A0A9GNT3_ARUDO